MVDRKEIGLIPFWDKLSRDEQEYLRLNSNNVSYKKGSFIYSHDMACLGVIFLQSGRIRVFTMSDEGREITLFHIEAGNYCVFSAACAISQISLETEMITEEDTRLIAISPSAYNKVAQQNIAIKCLTYELIIKRMTTVANVMSTILFERIDTRLSRFLLTESAKSKSGDIRMTQEEIATELNTAREVVARTLKRFSNDNLIKVERGRIIVLDKEELKFIAGGES